RNCALADSSSAQFRSRPKPVSAGVEQRLSPGRTAEDVGSSAAVDSAVEGLGQLFRVTCGDQPIGCGVVGVVDVDAHRVLRPGTDLEEGTGVEIDSASLLRRFALV